jgi:putative modified peptide
MGKSMLPRHHGIALLRKLASDDSFRQRFEIDPARELAKLGIDVKTIEGLDASCCQSSKLDAKETYAKLLEDVDGEQFHVAMSMHVHQITI